jgi:DNA repair protein RecN (Recombination protein N)
MLKSLIIKNYALIDEVEVEFQNGLNIITGETGAGKSIIMDSLNLVLGERANTDVIRKGELKAVVEAHFDVSNNKKVKKIIESQEIDFFDDLILRREIHSKGQNRCFINDTPATVNALKEVGDSLMDLHGQHEHQSLLRAESHIDLVDEFGSLQGLVDEYRQSYDLINKLFKQLDEILLNEKSLKDKMSLYEYQIKEIDEIDPKENEIEELESELSILENFEELHDATSSLYDVLYANENSIRDQLVMCKNKLDNLSKIDKAFSELQSEAKNAEIIVDEITKFIQNYNSKIEFDPERLEDARKRLLQLNKLKKKYGGSLSSVIEHREKIGKEYSLAENFEFEIENLKKQIENERAVCTERALRLSNKRKEVARKIEKSIVIVLKDLGIEKASFEVRFDKREISGDGKAYVMTNKTYYDATYRGIDIVEFYVSLNEGEELKPLIKVASGGEISRIMLSLKSILAKSDRLPGLAFDEIDVGVSGRIAKKVGQCLKNLANYHQILAITHLPQIAGLADVHFVVEKKNDKQRVFSNIRKLNNEERIHEIAKLISGENVTESAIAGAKELMGI